MSQRLHDKLKDVREQRFSLLARRDELVRLAASYQAEIQTLDRTILQMDGAIEALLFALEPADGDDHAEATPTVRH